MTTKLFWRPIKIALVIIFGALTLNTVERLYLVNGESYPRFLGQGLGDVDFQVVTDLRDQYGSLDIYQKRAGEKDIWVIRAGFGWLDGRTFISDTNPVPGNTSRFVFVPGNAAHIAVKVAPDDVRVIKQ
jgi:hypothetical protein